MPRKHRPGRPCRCDPCGGAAGCRPCKPPPLGLQLDLWLFDYEPITGDLNDVAGGCRYFAVPMKYRPLELRNAAGEALADEFWIVDTAAFDDPICKAVWGGELVTFEPPGGSPMTYTVWSKVKWVRVYPIIYCTEVEGLGRFLSVGVLSPEGITAPQALPGEWDYVADDCLECGTAPFSDYYEEFGSHAVAKTVGPGGVSQAIPLAALQCCVPGQAIQATYYKLVNVGFYGGDLPPGPGGSLVAEVVGGDTPTCPVDCEEGECRTSVSWIYYCPESCERDPYVVREVGTTRTYGPYSWSVVEGAGPGGCSHVIARAAVCLPVVGGAVQPATFELLDADSLLPLIDESDRITAGADGACAPAVRAVGPPADTFEVRFCLAGCPTHLPLSGLDSGVTVTLLEDDGEGGLAQVSQAFLPGGGPCFGGRLDLPDTSGDFVLRLFAEGLPSPYTLETPIEIPLESLPARGERRCFTLDLGTQIVPLHGDYVCTCGGPVQKCIRWSGNGAPVELHYVEGSDPPTWRGYEVTPAAYPYDVDGICREGSGPQDTAVVVELEIRPDGEGGCEAEARRLMHQCACQDEGASSPCYNAGCSATSPRLMANPADIGGGGDPFEDPGDRRSKAVVPLEGPWGPLDPFPGLAFGGAVEWTRPDGTPDPDACLGPPEAYTDATANNCTSEPEAMALRAPAPAGEPPLPSPLRMAGQLARAAGATARRIIRREPVRASEATQAARWAACMACDHFRPSDRRCGKATGCGCHLDRKIGLAAASCPLRPPTWGPEPVSPPPASPGA